MITYWDNFTHSSHPSLPWSASSLSSEHREPSRAIMESSLFFTDGALWSGVSRYRNELAVLRYLVELQEHTEG